MKIVKFTDHKNKEYSFLILESIQDVHDYNKLNGHLKSKQAIGFWMGFKSQTFHQSATDYCVHQVEAGNSIAFPLSISLETRNKSTSIVEYCNLADNIINSVYSGMLTWAIEGNLIRVNNKGGHCPISHKELEEEYTDIQEIDNQQMYNFMVHNDINYDFSIKSHTICIENADYTPSVVKKVSTEFNIPLNEIQTLTRFKTRTLMFKVVDYKNFFEEGVKNGLQNIVVETTGQDVKQINDLKSILQSIMFKHPNKQLNIYLKVYERHQKHFATEQSNIKIIFV